MTAGKAFLLKVGNHDEPLTFTTVAGLRVKHDTMTDGGYSVTAEGVFTGSMAETRVRSIALSGGVEDFHLSFESGERMQGKFVVARLDYAGDYNSERTYTISLESSGPVVSL